MQQASVLYYRSRLVHGDLVAAYDKLQECRLGPDGSWVQSLKAALTAMANLADLEGALRPLYKGHPQVAARMKELRPSLDFAKYLRNVYVGHINDDLIAKAFEWRPEMRALPEERTLTGTFLLNIYVLETAINTYVAPDGSHGMFPSETDLIYPPNAERFGTWLAETMYQSIKVLDEVATATYADVEPLGEGLDMMEKFKAAGLNDFSRLKKGR